MIFRLAGIVGVKPWSFTLGELIAMSDAKERAAWNRAAAIMSLLHNVHCQKRSQCRPPKHFHPMESRRSPCKKLDKKLSMAALKAAFIKGDKDVQRFRD